MNAQKLAVLARDDRAAKIFFAAYSRRRRSFHETALQEVMDLARRAGIGISPADVTAFFRGLEDAQCGQMLEDAGGPRFEWLVKSTGASKLALQTTLDETALAQSEEDGGAVAHTLRLRADWTLTLELPADFTRAEAKRLCHFVRALPLEEQISPEEDKPAND